MVTTFIKNVGMQLAIEKNRVHENIQISRWNFIDQSTKKMVKLIDPKLNQEIVNRTLKLFEQPHGYAGDEFAYNTA